MLIKQKISLKEKNWFKTGGKSKYFCQPTNKNDFVKAIEFANDKKLSIFMLGKGANLLISDDGFNGLTINPQLNDIQINGELVTVGAGIEIQNLIDYCLDNNLIGLEEFSNIPGTIGGSIYINIHYFSQFLSDFLVNATVINRKTSQIINVDKNWFNFGYDQSTLQKKEFFLVNATLKLKKVTEIGTAYAKGKRDEIIRYRNRQYPTSNTCGSFFRNFYDDEVNLKNNGKKMIYVAYYLDKLGIKGELQAGKAQVSYKHANMIITQNSAKSNDVINLAKTIQKLTWEKYKIMPQPECQFIGFKKYPLWKMMKLSQSVPNTIFSDYRQTKVLDKLAKNQ